jgi:hypothetical protein
VTVSKGDDTGMQKLDEEGRKGRGWQDGEFIRIEDRGRRETEFSRRGCRWRMEDRGQRMGGGKGFTRRGWRLEDAEWRMRKARKEDVGREREKQNLGITNAEITCLKILVSKKPAENTTKRDSEDDPDSITNSTTIVTDCSKDPMIHGLLVVLMNTTDSIMPDSVQEDKELFTWAFGNEDSENCFVTLSVKSESSSFGTPPASTLPFLLPRY